MFLRQTSQREPKRGWFCSKKCRLVKKAEKINRPCWKCGSLIADKKNRLCGDCVKKHGQSGCVICGCAFIAKSGQQIVCSSECYKKRDTEKKKKQYECDWCGAFYVRTKKPKKGRRGAAFCGTHCKESSNRLREYVRKKSKSISKAMRNAASSQRNKTIEECSIVVMLRDLEEKTRQKTELELWCEKIRSLIKNQSYRVADAKNRVDWLQHDRNRISDWRHGGAWGRIVYLELKRLSKVTQQTETQKWEDWLGGRLSSQTKRMKRKQMAGRPHGN
jgi:hypothetical protein